MQKMFERNELSIDSTKTCGDCRFWVGRCTRGRWNMLCSSPACENFELKKGVNKHG